MLRMSGVMVSQRNGSLGPGVSDDDVNDSLHITNSACQVTAVKTVEAGLVMSKFLIIL